MVFTRVEHVRAYQRVVAQVEEAILTGEIAAGGHLPSERDLVVQFGVSRATVREALRVLESAGLISSRPGDPAGALVLAMTTTNLSRSMSIIARRERLQLADLLQFRMFIESSVCELAACVRTDGQLVAIQEALERMRTSMDEGFDAFSQADLDFHLSIAAATDNPLLQACDEVILGLVRTMVRDKLAEAPDTRRQMSESLVRHEMVLAAIEAGDAPRAAHLARIHQLEYYGAHLAPDVRDRLERLCREPS
jgi:GntR family transcriptional repressor for pyruvate dehydrogenase complex